MKLAIFATLVAGTAAFVGPQKASVSNYGALLLYRKICVQINRTERNASNEFSPNLMLPTL